VLVVGAGLLVRSLLLLNAVHPGLDPQNVVALQVPFPRTSYKNAGNTPSGGLMVQFDSRFEQRSEQLRQRLATIPGVQSATAAMTPPLGGAPWRMQFRTARSAAARQEREGWSAEWYPVSAAYFDTLRIPVLRGRAIAADDHETGRPVAVINETMARMYWGGEDPVGQLLYVDLLDDAPREIVGVVGNVAQDRYQVGPQPQLYVSRAQLPRRMDMNLGLDVLATTFLVRTAGDPAAVLPSLRAAVRETDAALPIASVRTVDDYAGAQLRELSQYAMVLGLFGMLSVTLAVVGIVGVMAQTVGQRTNEFGIRLALGAAPGSVLALVFRQASALVAIGLGVGLVASLVLMPAIRRLLWGVSETDFVTLAAAVTGLAVVALAACYVPARRAMKVNPLVALRAE
jgi:putative ABC transport system permease protein